MKRLSGLLMAFLLLLQVMPATAEVAPALYTGKLRNSAQLFKKPDEKSDIITIIPAEKKVEILEIDPFWLRVRYMNEKVGYVKRSKMSDTSVVALDPAKTPNYAAVPCQYLGWIKEDTGVLKAPKLGAESFITLHKGARLALIDITDGWARIIFHRSYGYIDTRKLSEIQPFNTNFLESEDYSAPIAAYTSFYNISTSESNLGRIQNLKVGCDRLAMYVLNPGDSLDFNLQVGPYSPKVGYMPANVLLAGEIAQAYGGGTCQVSSTLYNTVMQMPGIGVEYRRAHGPGGAAYLPHGADAAVGNKTQNFVIQNNYAFPVKISGSVQDGALTIAVYKIDPNALPEPSASPLPSQSLEETKTPKPSPSPKATNTPKPVATKAP